MSAQFVSRSLPLFLSIAECRRLQYEHPHAWPPSEFLSGHSVPGPERCRAAGKANWRARCGVFTNGYKREPLAAYGYRCQQEEGRKERYNMYNERSQSSAVGCVCAGVGFDYSSTYSILHKNNEWNDDMQCESGHLQRSVHSWLLLNSAV